MEKMVIALLMFWNVENYFVPFHDTLKQDEAFTPGGEKFWSWKKFYKKRDDISRTVMLVKEAYGCYPALLGLCEVENAWALRQLVLHTPLARLDYAFLHRESPDRRGIDVALLYRKGLFRPSGVRYLRLPFPTRDILYAKGVFCGREQDTLHLLVCHWPSKLGGEKVSLPRRMAASSLLRHTADSILRRDPQAAVVAMGDFNDVPGSIPLDHLRGTLRNLAETEEGRLFRDKGIGGTHKYRESWEMIDQILVSPGLLAGKSLRADSMAVFAPPQLLMRDSRFLGVKLRRTLSGPGYLGGVSDHLPVLLKIFAEPVRK